MAVKTDPATWSDPRHQRGHGGEILARAFLEARGYRTLAHRFRVGRFEVDLIVERSDVVAFVEVKTRGGTRYGRPSEAVTWSRRRDMKRVASAWEDRSGPLGSRVIRFDVVEVLLARNASVASIRHIEDAFRPDWR